MANVILGDQDYTEQPLERSFVPNRGWQNVRRFKGTATSLATLETQYIDNGWSTKFTEGPVCELTCTYGGEAGSTPGTPENEVLTSTWEIQASVGEVDILKSPLVDNLDTADRSLLKDISNGNKKSEDVTVSDFVNAAGFSLFKLMIDGAAARQIFFPTLRHTQSGSNIYSFSPALYAVGQVVSTANLLARQPSIPRSIRNNIEQSSQVTRNGLDFVYGWLTSYPQISVTIDFKSQLIQEWQWGLWSELLYTYNS